jgi:hypothetical protein
MAYGGIGMSTPIFCKNPITSCDVEFCVPIFMTRNIVWFLAGDQHPGLLEVLKFVKKNQHCKTRFGSIIGDHFKNKCPLLVVGTKTHQIQVRWGPESCYFSSILLRRFQTVFHQKSIVFSCPQHNLGVYEAISYIIN